MEAGAHLEPELCEVVADGERAANRPRRAVEAREEAVAGGVELDSAVARELLADAGVMLREQVSPAAVAELGLFAVEPTRSVKSTVARTLSGSASTGGAVELETRKRSTSR